MVGIDVGRVYALTFGVGTALDGLPGALASTLFLIVWRYAGFYMLLMLVGLQAIPTEIYEAARIDGAGRWDTFRRITIPLLRPTLALTTILCVTGSLLAFEQFYILTKGGPSGETTTMIIDTYNVAIGSKKYGEGAARAVVICIFLSLFCLAYFRVTRRLQTIGRRA